MSVNQYASLMAGVWKTEVIEYDHTDHEYAFRETTQVFDLLTALGQEPLQMLAEITRSDLPYSEIVTGRLDDVKCSAGSMVTRLRLD